MRDFPQRAQLARREAPCVRGKALREKTAPVVCEAGCCGNQALAIPGFRPRPDGNRPQRENVSPARGNSRNVVRGCLRRGVACQCRQKEAVEKIVAKPRLPTFVEIPSALQVLNGQVQDADWPHSPRSCRLAWSQPMNIASSSAIGLPRAIERLTVPAGRGEIRRVGDQIVPECFHQLQFVYAGQGFEREQGSGLRSCFKNRSM